MNHKKTQVTDIAVIKEEVSPVVILAKKIDVKDAKSMETASELRTRLKQYDKTITTEKAKVLDPLNAARKAEMARWKPVETVLEQAFEILDTKMSDYQTAEKKRADEEAARIAARIGEGKGKLKLETAVEKIGNIDTPAKVVVTDSGSTKWRTDKRLKVTDKSKIPLDYLEVNDSKLKQALLAGIVIEGAEIEEVQVPVNSR